MGSEMAYNLFSKTFAQEKDAHFIVCDALKDNATKFASNFLAQFPGAHVSIAETPGEAALSAKTLITMLPSTPQVREVYEEHIMPAFVHLGPQIAGESIAIDSTTLDVKASQAVALRMKDLCVAMVDAPVSGGVTGAKAGTLAFLVGGTEPNFRQAEPTLSLMGKRIVHCGPSGAGLGAKIANNLMLGVQQIVTAEALLLGQRLGLDPAVLSGVIGSSTGNCWSLSTNNPVPGALPDVSPPCEREYDGGFATNLMLKDMGLALEVGQETSTPLPLGKAAAEVYARVVKERPELGGKDFSAVYKYLYDQAVSV